MPLNISQLHRNQIQDLGQASYPNECCGFLLGKVRNAEREVVSLLEAENAREDSEQYHRFLITPEMYMEADKQARQQGLDVIGFFHSHPDAPARPSDYDLEHAWPWYSYVIVSVRDGASKEITSWMLQEDRTKFSPEEIFITNNQESLAS